MGKLKRRRLKWIGILSKDLLSIGGSEAGKEFDLKKGQKVIVRKKKVYDSDGFWTRDYEYHYTNEFDTNLVRMSEFLLEEGSYT